MAGFVRTYSKGSAARSELTKRVDVTILLGVALVPTLIGGAGRTCYIFTPAEVEWWTRDVRGLLDRFC